MSAQLSANKRLLGTWKSDARRTLDGWVFPKGLSPAKRRRFSRIFGQLIVRYTPSRILSDFKGHRTVDRYKVLGRDQGSVAILTWKDDPARGEISHIRFRDDHYFVMTAAAPNVEFFRRVRKRTSNPGLQRTAVARGARRAARNEMGRRRGGR